MKKQQLAAAAAAMTVLMAVMPTPAWAKAPSAATTKENLIRTHAVSSWQTKTKTSVQKEGAPVLSWPDDKQKGVTVISVEGVDYTYQGDVRETGLNLGENAPTVNSIYEVGYGYVLYRPAATASDTAVVVLRETSFSLQPPQSPDPCVLRLPAGKVSLVLEDHNFLNTSDVPLNAGISTNGAGESLTISGSGSLDYRGNGSGSDGIKTPLRAGCPVTMTGGTLDFDGSGPLLTCSGLTVDGGTLNLSAQKTAVVSSGKITLNGGSGAVKGDMEVQLPETYSKPAFADLFSKGEGCAIDLTGVTALNAKKYSDPGSYWCYYDMTGKELIAPVPSGTLELDKQTETVSYRAGQGTVTWRPTAKDQNENVTEGILTLDNATLTDGIDFGEIPTVTMEVKGTNTVTTSRSNAAILALSLNLVGTGTLTAASGASAPVQAGISPQKGFKLADTVTLNALVHTLDANGNPAADTVYGTVTLTAPQMLSNFTVKKDAVLTVNEDVRIDLGGKTINEGRIVNKGSLMFPIGTTAEEISAFHIENSGTIRVAQSDGTPLIYQDGRLMQYMRSDGRIDLFNTENIPQTETYYSAGIGYVKWTPEMKDEAVAGGTITFHDAVMPTNSLQVLDAPVAVKLEGSSRLASFNGSKLTFSGSGALNCERMNPLEDGNLKMDVTGGTVTVNENTICPAADITVAGGVLNAIVGTKENEKIARTVYGQMDADNLEASTNGTLTLAKGSVLQISEEGKLDIVNMDALVNEGGKIVNNGDLKWAETGSSIQTLLTKLPGLSGSGQVILYQDSEETAPTYYTNDGTALHALIDGLDLSAAAADQGNLEQDGYHWDNAAKTLTLNNLTIVSTANGNYPVGLALPKVQGVKLVLEGGSRIGTFRKGFVQGTMNQTGAINDCSVTISGSGSLTASSDVELSGGVTLESGTVNLGSKQVATLGELTMNGGNLSATFEDREGQLFVCGNTAMNGGRLTVNRITGAYGMVFGGDLTMSGGELLVNGTGAKIAENGIPSMGIVLASSLAGNAAKPSQTMRITGGTVRISGFGAAVVGMGANANIYADGMEITTNPAGGKIVRFTSPEMEGNSVVLFAVGSVSSLDDIGNICGDVTIRPAMSPLPADTSSTNTGSKDGTVTNADGSTTTTTTDKTTGTVTQTTKSADGAVKTVETQKDGTVATKLADKAGNTLESVKKPDGSMTATVTKTDGTKVESKTATDGKTTATVTLPSGAEKATVTIPTPEKPKAGLVAVITKPDGTKQIVKNSVPTTDGVAVTLTAGATVELVDNAKTFKDVPADNWAKDAVDFVSARGMMNGATTTDFNPQQAMNRAMIWSVLYRQSVENAADSTSGKWYEAAQKWAQENNLSDGSNPTGDISRQQLITILWRAAGSPKADGTLTNYTDASSVADYAKEALAWAVKTGIVSGTDAKTLNPESDASRAQVAAILMRYLQNLAK